MSCPTCGAATAIADPQCRQCGAVEPAVCGESSGAGAGDAGQRPKEPLRRFLATSSWRSDGEVHSVAEWQGLLGGASP